MKRLGDGVEVEDYLAECVQIEPMVLQEEFVRVPADLAYWGERYAKALRAHLLAKIALDTESARVSMQVRATLIAENGKTTEGAVSAATDMHPDFQEASLAAVEAEVEKVRMHGVLDAIRSKRDMLISLGAHARAEMEHDPTIKEQSRSARLTRDNWKP